MVAPTGKRISDAFRAFDDLSARIVEAGKFALGVIADFADYERDLALPQQ